MISNKVICIEIGNTVTRIIQMDYQVKHHPKIYHHVSIKTPVGVYNDGYLTGDIAPLASAIAQCVADNKMTGNKNVIFTVASSKILTREVLVPPVKPNMIDSTVKMNLNEYFPIDLSQHEVSNLVLEHVQEGENAGKYRVLIVAAEKELVKGYENLAAAAGLTLIQLDYVGNSIFQTFKNENVERCNMILKMEETQTSITIVDHSNLLLQRTINYGAEEIIQEVANRPAFACGDFDGALAYVRDNVCLLESMGETANSITAESVGNLAGGVALVEAKVAVTRSLSGFINAVSRVIDFYNSRYKVPIDRIYVVGMGGDLSGINKLLSNELGIKTHILKKLEEIQWVAFSDDSSFHGFAATIGAGINPIGLYSKAKIDKEKRATNYKMLGLLVFVLLVIIAAAIYFPKLFDRKTVMRENEDLKRLEAQYVEAQQIYEQYLSTLSVYQQIYSASLMIENPNDNILIFFNELEKKLPSDVEISGFSSDDAKCTMSIVASSKEEAAGIIDMFYGFDSLMSVSVTNLTETPLDEEEATDEDTAITDEVVEEAESEDGEEEKEIKKSRVEFTIICEYYPSNYEVDIPVVEPVNTTSSDTSSDEEL